MGIKRMVLVLIAIVLFTLILIMGCGDAIPTGPSPGKPTPQPNIAPR